MLLFVLLVSVRSKRKVDVVAPRRLGKSVAIATEPACSASVVISSSMRVVLPTPARPSITTWLDPGGRPREPSPRR